MPGPFRGHQPHKSAPKKIQAAAFRFCSFCEILIAREVSAGIWRHLIAKLQWQTCTWCGTWCHSPPGHRQLHSKHRWIELKVRWDRYVMSSIFQSRALLILRLFKLSYEKAILAAWTTIWMQTPEMWNRTELERSWCSETCSSCLPIMKLILKRMLGWIYGTLLVGSTTCRPQCCSITGDRTVWFFSLHQAGLHC